MNLAQENFERAVTSGSETIKLLHGIHPSQIKLEEESTKKLREMAWDLDAIQAAIRIELNHRDGLDRMDMA